MDQMKIGEFIRELRKENGLTQEQLAEQLNVSRRTVSRWETGNNLPDLDVLIEMILQGSSSMLTYLPILSSLISFISQSAIFHSPLILLHDLVDDFP